MFNQVSYTLYALFIALLRALISYIINRTHVGTATYALTTKCSNIDEQWSNASLEPFIGLKVKGRITRRSLLVWD